MTPRELKKLFVDFFVAKNHVEIPSASLVPENDPTTLFISAGMHPLVPFLLGQPHPLGKRLVNVQKCVRTGDIDCVGDEVHHTFFEMLGNWSLGDYFKKEMISWSYEFLTQKLNLDPARLSITCFAGDTDAPKDTESFNLWKSVNIRENQIRFLPKADNWWGPAGSTGPCGPDTEMFYDGIEVWNDVFMQYNLTADGKYVLLPQPNVDTGMGVERTITVLNGFTDDYLTVIWLPIIKKIEELSGKRYQPNSLPCQGEVPKGEGFGELATDFRRPMRIIADHLRAAVFIIADGVEPSNKEAGYVLRRLIRRSVREAKRLGVPEKSGITLAVAEAVLHNQDNYAGEYPELNTNKHKILEVLEKEEKTFAVTLDRGLREMTKLVSKLTSKKNKFSGTDAFKLYESYGFPKEMIKEELEKDGYQLDEEAFEKARQQHIEKSRTLSAGMFKSGLADNSEIMAKYHTATHLLHAALRQILGTHVQQAGSNITADRLRFDFSHPDKLSPDQLKAITNLVNQKIQEGINVMVETMKFADAQKKGALAFFGARYPEIVTVYAIGDFSQEVCTGPHVSNTQKLGRFEILREESAGSGKRRLYAILK